jgi:mannitol/fructose-specific phosphotransferase system IIA component
MTQPPKDNKKYHLVGPDTVICLKCDKPLQQGDAVQQVIVAIANSTCEHKTMLRNIHNACLEKSNG